jgi:hypothetical protein
LISKTQKDFWICYAALPAKIQEQVREKFHLWQRDSFNAALHFKRLFEEVWSVRINQNYRALGRRSGVRISEQGQFSFTVRVTFRFSRREHRE